MIGRDVEQHGHIGLELIHVVQLETAQLDDIHIVMLGSHLQGQAATHVSGQAHVQAGLLEDMIGQLGGRGLAVAAGDAHHLGVGIAACELNLAHDGDTLLDGLGDHGCRVGDAGALDNLVGIEDFLRGVSAFLPCDAILVKQVLIVLPDFAGITQPHVHAFNLSKHRSTGTALASA